MKGRNILIVTGAILVLFNALSYVAGSANMPEDGTVNKIAYIIGRNMLFIIGLILLLIAYSVHKRVLGKRKKEMLDSFLK